MLQVNTFSRPLELPFKPWPLVVFVKSDEDVSDLWRLTYGDLPSLLVLPVLISETVGDLGLKDLPSSSLIIRLFSSPEWPKIS